MPHCAAVNCRNSEKKGFLMQYFPRDRKKIREWLLHLNRGDWIPTGDSVLCEVHFAPGMWRTSRHDGTRKLRKNAIPTVFPPPTPSDTVESDDSTDSCSDTVSVTSSLSTETVIDLFSCDETLRKPPELLGNPRKKLKVLDDSVQINEKKEERVEAQVLENKPSSNDEEKKENLEETDSKIQGGEKTFACNVCECKCETESFYHMHKRVHVWEKLLPCPRQHCFYMCSKKWQLDAHEKSHAGE